MCDGSAFKKHLMYVECNLLHKVHNLLSFAIHAAQLFIFGMAGGHYKLNTYSTRATDTSSPVVTVCYSN